jgi:hypothetical protein
MLGVNNMHPEVEHLMLYTLGYILVDLKVLLIKWYIFVYNIKFFVVRCILIVDA